MTATPQELIAAGQFDKSVPVLIGSNIDEFSRFINAVNLLSIFVDTSNLPILKPRMTENDFDNLIGHLGANNVKKVKQLYDPSVYEYPRHLGLFSQWWWMAMRVATDHDIPFKGFGKGVAIGHCSMRRVAEHLLRGGAPVLYMYNFARSLLGGQCGHGMDVPFVFSMDAFLGVSPGNKALSRAMITYWANFAVTGQPSGDGLPQWPPYAADGDKADLRLDATFFAANITVEYSYRQAACDFWDRLAAAGPAWQRCTVAAVVGVLRDVAGVRRW
eukprot:NODE_1845_length_1050_cov_358.167839.p1 GENE.NODE_1845_length_1050_cov_358.167839~~NODE_1845_length_1050_cov_358.167839.p1  ORF type:complete len:315 (+),score=61.72 NODE_1845_length_1050_cov_358.167839:128-946(+)